MTLARALALALRLGAFPVLSLRPSLGRTTPQQQDFSDPLALRFSYTIPSHMLNFEHYE